MNNNTHTPRRRTAIAIASVLAIIAIVFSLCIQPRAFAQESARTATVLVYMNGSDLESEAGAASADIAEMLEAKTGPNVNVVIETLGTSEWQDYGIASNHAQRYALANGRLELVDDTLGQLETTSSETFDDFIDWGTKAYPADRYMLVLWGHGGGSVYGFGYNEDRVEEEGEEDTLTLDEMQQALQNNSDVHFDFIGMDSCMMSSLETCMVLQPYCDYAILSEDFEPGIGWSYNEWLGMLEKNPGVSTEELGKVVVDGMVGEVSANIEENGEATLALIDESKIDELFRAWTTFAYANEDALLSADYSEEMVWEDWMRSGMHEHGHGWELDEAHDGHDGLGAPRPDEMGGPSGMGGPDEIGDACPDCWDCGYYATISDFGVTDISEVAATIQGSEATALVNATEDAIVYYQATEGEEGMSGIGVALPYGDSETYAELQKVFTNCGIDSAYVDWLGSFVDA